MTQYQSDATTKFLEKPMIATPAPSQALTQLVILQPSSFCNLDCHYCYVPGRTVRSVIKPEVLEQILTKVFQSSTVAEGFCLSWHNGEPLSLGRQFYLDAFEVIRRVNTSHKSFCNNIQTNATLITQEWADFFLEHNMSIGISIDGPKHLHDTYRKTRSGKGSFDAVMRGVRCLRDNKIPLSALCVVTAELLDHGTELIEFYLSEGFTSLGFIIEHPTGLNPSSSFSQARSWSTEEELEERYQKFIGDVFDAWFPHKDRLAIREFNEMFLAFKLVKLDHAAYHQAMDNQACGILTFSINGDVTTFSPEMIAGTTANPRLFAVANIMDLHSLEEIASLIPQQRLNDAILAGKKRCERECGYFPLCGGGAPVHKFYENGTFDCTQTRACRYGKQLLADVLLSKITQIKNS
jgi:uncharacterized protein